MITQNTIQTIQETVQIDEVVGDFVQLKKRGSNLLGCCPFHNEKTPSFTVSPHKGIYKCFGCGVSGDSIKFVMEHEQYSYPEALKYLAEKYRIEIEETEVSAEQKEARKTQDSLYIVNSYANNYFKNALFNTDEGKSLGLAYFKERGFIEKTLEEFDLGYHPNTKHDFTKAAIKEQYEEKYLRELGLMSKNGYDFFRGRVMFPIHNLSGKVIAFGGRTLEKDGKPKYLNSPESEIYHKSKVLYGLYQAKKHIVREDECLMVEGYTDVISLAQNNVQNVVASSGTALTEGQIRLVNRFTKNMCVIYDGDAAGLKASFRGIDLILEQDMNVRVVPLPEGEDPDSHVRNLGTQGFMDYLEANKKDFIPFKAEILLKEVKDDPIKKTEAIRSIVDSIAKVPDQIKRSLYVQQCSTLLNIDEQILISETNKSLVKGLKNDNKSRQAPAPMPETTAPQSQDQWDEQTLIEMQMAGIPIPAQKEPVAPISVEETELIRVLMEFGSKELEEEQTVADYIFSELEDIEFEHGIYQKIYNAYKEKMQEGPVELKFFLTHSDEEIKSTAIDFNMSEHQLSENWYNIHEIIVQTKDDNFANDAYKVVANMQFTLVQRMIAENQEKMKTAKEIDEIMELQKTHLELKGHLMEISKFLGIVVN